MEKKYGIQRMSPIVKKLKSATSYCIDSNISLSWEDAKNNTNELNFDALPLGRINADGVPENRLNV